LHILELIVNPKSVFANLETDGNYCGARLGEYGGRISSNMFPILKTHLCGQRFLIDNELNYFTKEWLRNSENFSILQASKHSKMARNCAMI